MPVSFDTLKKELLPQFESSLKDCLQFNLCDDRRLVEDAIHYSVLYPGKRIRPLICMATEKSLSNNIGVSIIIAIATELIHCYSLIHDDLPAMDDDDFRRGQPTCHKKFGEDIAILSGDILNSYAFEYLSSNLLSYTDAKTALKIIKLFSQVCGINGMAGGQALDIKSNANSSYKIKDLEKTHSLKTGSIIESCFMLPSLVFINDDSKLLTIKKIGKSYGLLFQIIDDIMDDSATLEEMGKSPGKDASQNKLTYISLLGQKESITQAKSYHDQAITLIKSLNLEQDYLTPIIQETYKKGLRFCNR